MSYSLPSKDRFRLIASGEFVKGVTSTNLNDIIQFHLMGAAEYEGDKIWKAMQRMNDKFSDYAFMKTGIIGKNGLELVVFTKNTDVPRMIKRFIDNPYELKRPSHLEIVPKFNSRIHEYDKAHNYDFWYCIDNSDRKSLDFYSDYGDWMACYEDTSDLLLEALKKFMKENF